MTEFHPVSPDRHSQKTWRPTTDFLFSAKDALCPLVAHEIPEACLSLPIAFSRIEEKIVPVAVLGVKAEQNLIVDSTGHWRAPYLPRFYRTHPFSLAVIEDQQVLCIDEAKGQVSEKSDDSALPFFDDSNQPIQRVQTIFELLVSNHQNSLQTNKLCCNLYDLGLVEHWPLEVEIDRVFHPIDGLYRINEDAINQLPQNDLAELRDNGALVVIYSQLLSMVHMSNLVKLAQGSSMTSKKKELDFDPLTDGGTISFDNL